MAHIGNNQLPESRSFELHTYLTSNMAQLNEVKDRQPSHLSSIYELI